MLMVLVAPRNCLSSPSEPGSARPGSRGRGAYELGSRAREGATAWDTVRDAEQRPQTDLGTISITGVAHGPASGASQMPPLAEDLIVERPELSATSEASWDKILPLRPILLKRCQRRMVYCKVYTICPRNKASMRERESAASWQLKRGETASSNLSRPHTPQRCHRSCACPPALGANAGSADHRGTARKLMPSRKPSFPLPRCKNTWTDWSFSWHSVILREQFRSLERIIATSAHVPTFFNYVALLLSLLVTGDHAPPPWFGKPIAVVAVST